jgi:hypothetical protein
VAGPRGAKAVGLFNNANWVCSAFGTEAAASWRGAVPPRAPAPMRRASAHPAPSRPAPSRPAPPRPAPCAALQCQRHLPRPSTARTRCSARRPTAPLLQRGAATPRRFMASRWLRPGSGTARQWTQRSRSTGWRCVARPGRAARALLASNGLSACLRWRCAGLRCLARLGALGLDPWPAAPALTVLAPRPRPAHPLAQAAYIARANQDLPPAQMSPAPCSTAFPNLGVATLADPTPVTVMVRWRVRWPGWPWAAARWQSWEAFLPTPPLRPFLDGFPASDLGRGAPDWQGRPPAPQNNPGGKTASVPQWRALTPPPLPATP